MAECAGAITSITYHLITFLIESGQASDEVRRSLELVRTCDRDLQHLISLREEHLDILERKPIELVRINLIIEDAYKGLLEVARIVEKCRPEAHRGSLPFYRRGGWVLFDSKQFNSQVPVINAHHQSVLAEIGFLRTIALHVPSSAQGQAISVDNNLVQKRRVDIGGVSLLSGLIGSKPGMCTPIFIYPVYKLTNISRNAFYTTASTQHSRLSSHSMLFRINTTTSASQASFVQRSQFRRILICKAY